jgi:hypothetical protein
MTTLISPQTPVHSHASDTVIWATDDPDKFYWMDMPEGGNITDYGLEIDSAAIEADFEEASTL